MLVSFFVLHGNRTHLNATVRWTVAHPRLDGDGTILIVDSRTGHRPTGRPVGDSMLFRAQSGGLCTKKHIVRYAPLDGEGTFLIIDSRTGHCQAVTGISADFPTIPQSFRNAPLPVLPSGQRPYRIPRPLTLPDILPYSGGFGGSTVPKVSGHLLFPAAKA